MELLDTRAKVGHKARGVGVGSRVSVGGAVFQSDRVGGSVVSNKLGATTEGIQQQHVVLELIYQNRL